MLKRFAPLVPLTFALFLAACAGTVQQPSQTQAAAPVADGAPDSMIDDREPSALDLANLTDDEPYQMPSLADGLLERGFELVGTPYRFGGRSLKTGFDCSGFVGYLFKEEAGIQLPRSTREMINLDAPVIARSELQPGDIVFFNNRGRGRVSHAGIYIGDDQFIHSSSSRSGGVRVDSLHDRYWKASYMEAKRVLAMNSAAQGRSPLHR
ncbi:C40 family peptidase [Metapseudomonas furukawaii]|uniref:C40 family peptidase n=1 Tax=Metapseudomonas furukawaii TaxID=1149133 RepID=UPI0002ABDC2D|nr:MULTISPECIES: C40 family peptidase [Pseudomonas]ELS30070.1 NLP/P60 family protein [Pseudomonas furukawaii]OWJ97287.1 peptidase P60 [Pseudomonas sp. A46]WAG77476.1 C40 family peptidase [Pseudomonas furukawaii]